MALGQSYSPGSAPEPVVWHLPEEEPVALAYNGRTFAVMLASPADLEDFALGFSLSEQIIATPSELWECDLVRIEAGLVARMTIPSARAAALIGRRRALEGRSGCGLCGLESLEALHRPLPPVRPPPVTPEAIRRALDQLGAHQPMRARTHSVHGAAWSDPNGEILLAREDVGRHSALDKLIGAVSRAGGAFEAGFVVLSSRCGFELVQKAAAVGIGLIASVSAPTGLALTAAGGAGLVLAAAARGGGIVRFDPPAGAAEGAPSC